MWMDHVGGVFVSLIFWTFVGAVIIVPQYFKYKDRQRMHDTLRVAFEKGQPVPPEVIEALQSNVADRLAPTAERDLRRAIVLIAVGLGLCGLGYGFWYGLMAVNEMPAYIVGGIIAGTGAIPGLIGVAYLILWLTRRPAAKV
ncbi:MAG TPA: DUF6249 domain-containing protein [Caulobacteraceae bacterium]|jgi:hypothetical protein|nr:DUF6249 domain-containing protein [Caulobacteraceae bacterium]